MGKEKTLQMCLSPASIDFELVNAAKGYTGSSGDYSFVSSDSNIRECQLHTRNFVCSCISCLGGLLRIVKCRTGLVRCITSAAPLPQMSPRGGKTLQAFASGLQINEYAVHRIADSEKGDIVDQAYFIVRIESNFRKIASANETFGTNDYKRNTLVGQVRWLKFQSEDGNGNRWHSLGPLTTTSCKSVVRNLTRPIVLSYETEKNLFRLEQSLDTHFCNMLP